MFLNFHKNIKNVFYIYGLDWLVDWRKSFLAPTFYFDKKIW